MIDGLKQIGEYGAAGLYEQPDRGLFYRKALGLRRFYETCLLPAYDGRPLYPSGPVTTPDYMRGLALDGGHIYGANKEWRDRIWNDFFGYRSTVPPEHTVAGNMWTHSMPYYERVLREGLRSYGDRIRGIADTDMREGLLELLAGIDTYVTRCVDYLTSVGAEEQLVVALRRVPMEPARDIYEAVVAWNLVMYLDGCDNLGCVAAGLSPYHTGEDIVPLLENLFDNLDANNGYSMALHTGDGPLVLQCLEAVKGRRRPMVELFVDENTADEVWQKAFETMRTFGGQPAFYNPAALLGGLQRRFPTVTDEDIHRFCGGGCTESMIAGMSNVGSLDAGINLLLIWEQVAQASLAEAADFEAFYAAYIRAVGEVVDTVTREISRSREARAVLNPVPMRTLLVDDCIDKGQEYNAGGARYRWSIINFAGLVNVIDSMLVVRDLVFSKGACTGKELLGKLRDNDPAFLQMARDYPVAFGRDQEEANAFAHRLSTDIFSMLDTLKPYMGEGFLPSSIQFESQARAGKPVGATPDGRSAGYSLADSLAAIFGKDTEGPTALLNSVTSLNLERALGTPVLNFNVQPDFPDAMLKALILGYMAKGGIQMQITCLTREMLEEAYRHPEDHKNLVVRVAGYSEYFYRLSDELKRLVIQRTIQRS